MREIFTKSKILMGIVCLLLVVACTITPDPMKPEDVQGRVTSDLNDLFKDQEPISGPVALAEAIARAIKYNLDHRVGLMESAVNELNLNTLTYDMLPEVTANAGYTKRNNEAGSRSQSLLDNSQSLVFSKSQDRHHRTADLGFTWNILDFGMSYIRAKEEANMALVAEERRRKVIQNIIQDVRYAYWRALTAQNLIPKVDALLELAEQSLEDVRQIEEKRLQDPLAALSFQKVLLETVRDLTSLRWQLKLSKVELAALINVHPNEDFELMNELGDTYPIPQVDIPIATLEDLALQYRPELREEDYNARNAKNEVYKEYLDILPAPNVSGTKTWDDNRFLFNRDWTQIGASVAWKLVNLLSLSDRVDLAEAKETVVKTRRLAITMAILSQVNIAQQRYEQSLKDFQYAEQLDKVDRRILEQTESAQKSDLKSRLEFVQSFANSLLANLRKDVAYAELQNALGGVYVSIGADLLTSDVKNYPVAQASEVVRERINDWQVGRFTFNDQDIVSIRQEMRKEKEKKAKEENEKVSALNSDAIVAKEKPAIQMPPTKESLPAEENVETQQPPTQQPAPQKIDDQNLVFNIPGYEAVENNGRAIIFRKQTAAVEPIKSPTVSPPKVIKQVTLAQEKPKPKIVGNIKNILTSYLPGSPSPTKTVKKQLEEAKSQKIKRTAEAKEDMLRQYLGDE